MDSKSPHLLDPEQIVTAKLDIGAHGVQVMVKECLGIAGLPTRCGSQAFADAPAETAHSAIVERLIGAGAQIIGRVTMHELAFGVTGRNDFAGTAPNPNWPDRIVGGSSSGTAAAVAAGLCDFAVGTDTGGSIRQPACCNGVFGLKPSFGAIDCTGAIPRASSLDVIGPMAASADMLAKAAAMILPDFDMPQLSSMRLGSVPVEAEADVEAACAAALAGLDLTATPLPSFEAAHLAGLTLINAEIAAEFGALARSNATLGEDVRARILAALSVTPDDVAKAEMVRARFTAEVDAALTNVDALVLPTMPQVPPTLDEARDPRAVIPLTRLVRPFNLSGHPALTVPIRTGEGLPAGLQLVAPKGAEGRLCAMAQVFEERLSSSEPQEALT